MIVEILLMMFLNAINFFIALLPAPNSLPSGLDNTLESVFSYFERINTFLPIDIFFQVLGVVFTFEAGILLFKFFNFTVNKLRGSG